MDAAQSHGNCALHAVIPSRHIRAFSKILQCLSRIGDELYIEAYPNKLLLSTVNQARSVVAMIHCNARFFETYQVRSGSAYQQHTSNGFNQHNTASTFHLDEDTAPHCRVQLKALLSMFRTSSSIDKSVEQAELLLEDGQLGHPECRFNVRLSCKHGVVMARHLFYEVGEPLRAIYNKQSCRYSWRASSKTLGDWMAYFQPRLGELTTICTPTGIKLRSFDETNLTVPFNDAQALLRTELSADITEFERYQVESPVELTFGLKEFKVIVQLAENLTAPLSAHFEQEGSPMLLCIAHHELVTADFIVSTVTDMTTTMPTGMSSQASISEADPLDAALRASSANGAYPSSNGATRHQPPLVGESSILHQEPLSHPHPSLLPSTNVMDTSYSFLHPSHLTHPRNGYGDNDNDDDSVCEDSDVESTIGDESYEQPLQQQSTAPQPTYPSTSSSNKKARLLF